MELLVRWEEYKKISLKGSELPIEQPSWFYPFQQHCQRRIRNTMTQVQLYPNSYARYLLLFPFFRATLTEAICYDIDFMYEWKNLFLSYLGGNKSVTIGDYSEGPISTDMLEKILKQSSPMAYNCLMDMGWLNRSLQWHPNYKNYYMSSNDSYTEDRDPKTPYNQSDNTNDLNFKEK